MSQKNLKQFTLKCTYRNDLFYPPFLTPPPGANERNIQRRRLSSSLVLRVKRFEFLLGLCHYEKHVRIRSAIFGVRTQSICDRKGGRT